MRLLKKLRTSTLSDVVLEAWNADFVRAAYGVDRIELEPNPDGDGYVIAVTSNRRTTRSPFKAPSLDEPISACESINQQIAALLGNSLCSRCGETDFEYVSDTSCSRCGKQIR